MVFVESNIDPITPYPNKTVGYIVLIISEKLENFKNYSFSLNSSQRSSFSSSSFFILL